MNPKTQLLASVLWSVLLLMVIPVPADGAPQGVIVGHRVGADNTPHVCINCIPNIGDSPCFCSSNQYLAGVNPCLCLPKTSRPPL